MNTVDYTKCCEYRRGMGWVHAECRKKKGLDKGSVLMFKRSLDKGEKCAICHQTQEQLRLAVA